MSVEVGLITHGMSEEALMKYGHQGTRVFPISGPEEESRRGPYAAQSSTLTAGQVYDTPLGPV